MNVSRLLPPLTSAADLWLPGVHGRHPGRGQRRVGEEGGLPVPELPALGPSCGQLPVLGLPLLLVLRHHSQHGGADLSICQVISKAESLNQNHGVG